MSESKGTILDSNDLNRTPEHGDIIPSPAIAEGAADGAELPNEYGASIYIVDRPRPRAVFWDGVICNLGYIFVASVTGAVIALLVDFLLLVLLRCIPGHEWLLLLPIPGYIFMARYVVTKNKVFGYTLGIVSILLTLLLTAFIYLVSFVVGPPD